MAIAVAAGPHTTRSYAGRSNCFEFDVVIEPGRSVVLDVLSRNRRLPMRVAASYIGSFGFSRRPPFVIDPLTGLRNPGRVVAGRFRRPH